MFSMSTNTILLYLQSSINPSYLDVKTNYNPLLNRVKSIFIDHWVDPAPPQGLRSRCSAAIALQPELRGLSSTA